MGCAASTRKKNVEVPSKIPQNTLGAHYHVEHELGRGQFAVVRAGLQRVTGDKVAIKTLKRSQTNFDMDSIRQEIECMKQIRHPGCIQLLETFKGSDAMHLVQERAEGGDLWERIMEHGPISEQLSLHVSRQLADAVTFLHANGVCHRDLKPENIVLMSRRAKGDPTYWTAKITDYGFSKQGVQGYLKSMETVLGTPEFVAPELLKKMLPERVAMVSGFDQPAKYSAKVDIYSLGAILYAMIAGRAPFSFHDNLPILIQNIVQGQLDFSGEAWAKTSKELKQTVQLLMMVDPAKRPSASIAAGLPCIARAIPPSRTGPGATKAGKPQPQKAKGGRDGEGDETGDVMVKARNYEDDLDSAELIRSRRNTEEGESPAAVEGVREGPMMEIGELNEGLNLRRFVSDTPSLLSLKNAERDNLLSSAQVAEQ